MTENDAIYIIKEHMAFLGFSGYREALKNAITALEEVQQYRAIKVDKGYVEKLVNVVAKKIVDAFENLIIEDVNMYRIGYANAIAEFAKALCSRAEEESIEVYFPDGLYGLVVEIENLKDMVGKIAEKMKGGAIDG